MSEGRWRWVDSFKPNQSDPTETAPSYLWHRMGPKSQVLTQLGGEGVHSNACQKSNPPVVQDAATT
jgi:hypothetical protein